MVSSLLLLIVVAFFVIVLSFGVIFALVFVINKSKAHKETSDKETAE